MNLLTFAKLNMKVKVHHILEKFSTVYDFYKFYVHFTQGIIANYVQRQIHPIDGYK